MIDAYRTLRNPRWARDVRRDLRETRSSVNFLADAPPASRDAPITLVGLYRDNIYDAKLGYVLAAALAQRDQRVVVSIPSSRAYRLRRYGHAFGIEDFVAQEAIDLGDAETTECESAIARFFAGPLDVESIKTWKFREFAIGSHALSTLSRVTFDGSPDLSVNGNASILRTIVRDVVENIVRSERLLRDLRPRVLLVDEANYSVNGPLVDVALERGVDVIQTVTTWRDGALMSKRLTKTTRRVDAHSVSSETLARLREASWGAQQESELDADFAARYAGRWALGRLYQPDTVARSGEQIRKELALDPRRPTCVIFAHVLWDATLFFGDDLFDNYGDWLVNTVAAAIENPNVNWIIKAHPANVYLARRRYASPESSELALIQRRFTNLPSHVKILPAHTTISTLSIYEFADVGITVRGTPGMEIACFGKPAITAGTGAYSNLGFTYDSSSREEYLARLASLEQYGPIDDTMRTKARQYVHALFVRRPWEAGSFQITGDGSNGEGWHPLGPNIRVWARSSSEFDNLGDLGEWADWVLGGCDLDFVPKAHW
jgi:hypothetical protein